MMDGMQTLPAVHSDGSTHWVDVADDQHRHCDNEDRGHPPHVWLDDPNVDEFAGWSVDDSVYRSIKQAIRWYYCDGAIPLPGGLPFRRNFRRLGIGPVTSAAEAQAKIRASQEPLP